MKCERLLRDRLENLKLEMKSNGLDHASRALLVLHEKRRRFDIDLQEAKRRKEEQNARYGLTDATLARRVQLLLKARDYLDTLIGLRKKDWLPPLES